MPSPVAPLHALRASAGSSAGARRRPPRAWGFLDPAVFEQLLDRAYKRAGAQFDLAVAALGDIQHDPVSVERLIGQGGAAGDPRLILDDMIANKTSSNPADSHDLIRVQGARENNLKDVSVEIPKRRLTVFTGVSGSGKSSLVFGTIAAESQRLINETYSAFVQGFMPTLARPEVDVLEGLTTAIIVDQERMGANARSTVGTVTDANAMLRVLWSRLGKPHIGPRHRLLVQRPDAEGEWRDDRRQGQG